MNQERSRLMLAMALAWAAAWPCLAAAQCDPGMAAALRNDSGAASLAIAEFGDRYDEELQGRHGETVRTYEALEPGVLPGGLVSVPVPWQNLIDWNQYGVHLTQDDQEVRSPLIYRFEPGPTGSRLCRAERYEPRARSDARDEEAQGQPWRWQLRGVTQYRYAPSGQLVEVIDHDVEGQQRTSMHTCFTYDGAGRLLSYAQVSQNLGCRALPELEVRWRFMYDKTGRLTRSVRREPLPEGGERTTVTLYDAAGREVQRLVQPRRGALARAQGIDAADDPQAAGYHASARKLFVVPNAKVRSIQTDTRGAWRLVLLERRPRSKGDERALVAQPQKLLLAGTIDAQSRVALTPAQSRQLWEAVPAYPGRVALQLDNETYFAVSAYPDAQWKRCLDPKQSARERCIRHSSY